MNKEQLKKEWLEYTKPRMTVYNKLTDMEICALCGADTEQIFDWFFSRFSTSTQSLIEKIQKLYKNTNLISQPNPLNDPKFIAECVHNKAIQDVINLIQNQ